MVRSRKSENHTAGPKRQLASVSVGNLLDKVAGKALRRQGFAQSEIVARWPAVVGELLAKYSCPERLSFPVGEQSGGTLYIRTDGAFALELQHLEPIVLERINSYYGFPAVARLAIRQGPLPKAEVRQIFKARALTASERRELDQLLGQTDDAPLKQALTSLGEAILGSSTTGDAKPTNKRPSRRE